MNFADLHQDISSLGIVTQKLKLEQLPLKTGFYFGEDEIVKQSSIKELLAFNKAIIFSAIFPPLGRDGKIYLDDGHTWENFSVHYKYYKQAVNLYRDQGAMIITSFLQPAEKLSLVLHVEGLYFLTPENFQERINTLWQLGIRSVGPFWNNDNVLGSGNKTKEDSGFTQFGVKVIKYLADKEFIIDLAHTSYKSFFDIISLVPEAAIVFSHGNIYNLHKHDRNLRDEQLRALKEINGLIGLSAVGAFTGSDKLDVWRRHLDYVLEFGLEDNICFGTDFNGMFADGLIDGLEDIRAIPSLYHHLLKYYPEKILAKIFYENLWSFVKNNLRDKFA